MTYSADSGGGSRHVPRDLGLPGVIGIRLMCFTDFLASGWKTPWIDPAVHHDPVPVRKEPDILGHRTDRLRQNHMARIKESRWVWVFIVVALTIFLNSIVGKAAELSQEAPAPFQEQISGGVGLNETSLHDKFGNQAQGSGLFESVGGLFFLSPEKTSHWAFVTDVNIGLIQIPSVSATYAPSPGSEKGTVSGNLESLQGGIGGAIHEGTLTTGLLFEGGEIVQDFLPGNNGNPSVPNAAFLGSIPVPVLGFRAFVQDRWSSWGGFSNFAALWPLGSARTYNASTTPVAPVFYRGEVGGEYFIQPDRAVFLSMNLLYCSLVEMFWGPKIGTTFFF